MTCEPHCGVGTLACRAETRLGARAPYGRLNQASAGVPTRQTESLRHVIDLREVRSQLQRTNFGAARTSHAKPLEQGYAVAKSGSSDRKTESSNTPKKSEASQADW